MMAAFLLTCRVQHSMTPEGCGHVVKKSDTTIKIFSEAATRGDCQAQARYKSERGAVVGKLNVAVYTPKQWKLAIRSVVPSSTMSPYSLDRNVLQTYLNETIYNQGIVSWNVINLEPIVIPYDTASQNDCVDIMDLENDEAAFIRTFPHAVPVDPKITTVFLVKCLIDHSRSIRPLGIALRGKRVVFVADLSFPELLYYVIAHEIGHALFGLRHTCNDSDSLVGCESLPHNIDDEKNIMWRYADTAEGFTDSPKLRFWQWKRMQNTE